MSGIGSKEKIRQFLRANIGRVIESHEIQSAAEDEQRAAFEWLRTKFAKEGGS